MRTAGPWPAVVALAALSCSSALVGGKGDADDLGEVKKRIVELQRKATVAEVELARLRQQVAELEARLEAARRAAAQQEAPRPLPPSPAAPIGGREPAVVESSDLTLEQEVAPPRAPSAGRETQEQPAGRSRQPVDKDGQAVYDRGYTFYHQGRYVDAETSFQQFLQTHADTELADNAQYWIGEARFARGDVSGALAAFRETAERFAGGNKVPDALLKVGDCLARLGDTEGARAQYAEVVRRFPETAAAAMAEERREKLE